MASRELKQMGSPVLRDAEEQSENHNKDDVDLARVGKRPVLRVRLLPPSIN
jgi:hypothetical protein